MQKPHYYTSVNLKVVQPGADWSPVQDACMSLYDFFLWSPVYMSPLSDIVQSYTEYSRRSVNYSLRAQNQWQVSKSCSTYLISFILSCVNFSGLCRGVLHKMCTKPNGLHISQFATIFSVWLCMLLCPCSQNFVVSKVTDGLCWMNSIRAAAIILLLLLLLL